MSLTITSAYPALIDEVEPGQFLVTFRDVPEAITGGATHAESFTLAADALSVALEGYLAEGRPLPSASASAPGEVLIPVDVPIVARIAVIATMDSVRLSGRALADLMGKDEKHVRRIVAGDASLDQAVAALRVMGIRPTLEMPALRVDADRGLVQA